MNTSISNISILDDSKIESFSKEELSAEYINLKTQYAKLMQNYDKIKQENYETKRAYNIEKQLKCDLISEIDSLQTENEELRTKMNIIDTETVNYKSHSQLEIANLKSLNEYNEEIITDLNNKIHDLETKTLPKETDNMKQEIDKLNMELVCLSTENETLNEYIIELKNLSETEQNEKSELRLALSELTEENQEIKRSLENKKEQLVASDGLRQTMQAEMAMLRLEMESMKGAPLESDKKGNSLFAEVDDRRRQLQKEHSTMKLKYMDMKRKFALKNAEISKLQAENATLCHQWKESKVDQIDCDVMIKSAYETKINDLETTVKFLKEQLSKPNVSDHLKDNGDDFNTLKLIEEYAERCRKDVLKVQEKLDSEHTIKFLKTEALHATKKEAIKWKTEAMSLKSDLMTLKLQMEQMNNANGAVAIESETVKDIATLQDALESKDFEKISPIPENEHLNNVNSTSPVVFRPKSKDIAENVLKPICVSKENIPVEKCVSFAKNTVEPTVTDRTKYKKAGRNIATNYTTRFIPSCKKKPT